MREWHRNRVANVVMDAAEKSFDYFIPMKSRKIFCDRQEVPPSYSIESEQLVSLDGEELRKFLEAEKLPDLRTW